MMAVIDEEVVRVRDTEAGAEYIVICGTAMVGD